MNLSVLNKYLQYLLILRVFITFTKQFFTFHSNKVKCEKQHANAGGCGFESYRGKNLFFTFYSIRVECEELFCKTNKILKLTEKYFVWNDDILLKKSLLLISRQCHWISTFNASMVAHSTAMSYIQRWMYHNRFISDSQYDIYTECTKI